MKKIFLLLSVLAALASCQKSLEERAENDAHQLTRKRCPYVLAEGIIVDSMTFDRATHTLGYHYRLEGALDDPAKMDSASMSQALLQELRNQTSVRAYKEAGYAFRYIYYSTKRPGEVLFETTLKAE